MKLVIEKFITASFFVNSTMSFATDIEVTLMRKIIEDRMKALDNMHDHTKPEWNDNIDLEDLEKSLVQFYWQIKL